MCTLTPFIKFGRFSTIFKYIFEYFFCIILLYCQCHYKYIIALNSIIYFSEALLIFLPLFLSFLQITYSLLIYLQFYCFYFFACQVQHLSPFLHQRHQTFCFLKKCTVTLPCLFSCLIIILLKTGHL